MRIAVASIKGYKRVSNIVIEPEADTSWILVAGKNKQGKSSVFDAITRALRGKKAQAAKPVHEGDKEAEIILQMDNGVTIECIVLPDGSSHLEVRNADGASIKSPQAHLDAIIGNCFIDPLEFLRIGDAKQREKLLELIDKDGKIAALDKRHDAIFETRTEVGRNLKHAEGELSRTPDADVHVAINVADLSAERAKYADQQRQGDGLGAVAREKSAALRTALNLETEVVRVVADLERQLADVQRKLVEQRERQLSVKQAVETARLAEQSAVAAVSLAIMKWAESEQARLKLDADLARADEHNRAVVVAETVRKRRAEALATVTALQARRDQQTELLDKIAAQKVAALKAANLPADGLGFDATGLTLDGVPFAQASAAQRFMAALAIAAAASPGLDDVFLRDGAILDDDSLATIAAHAEATGKRYWVEVIKHDAATITIHDGRVVGGGS